MQVDSNEFDSKVVNTVCYDQIRSNTAGYRRMRADTDKHERVRINPIRTRRVGENVRKKGETKRGVKSLPPCFTRVRQTSTHKSCKRSRK